MGIGTAHNQRIAAAHLFMQQANRVVLVIVRPEGIGADQLRQLIGFMGVGIFDRAHFMDDDVMTGTGDLPCGFGPSQSAADNMK